MRKRSVRAIGLPVLWFSLAAMPMSAQQSAAARVPAAAPRAASVDAGRPAVNLSNYTIGAQDMLDISVWKEPDFSRSVQVRPDGNISIPLLGDIHASGLTPTELTTALTTSLTKYMTDPQVTVIVTQINSQRVYILGEVSRAGAYSLLPGMTVLQAISNAGGVTTFADSKKIYVLRQENGKQQKYFFNYKDVISGRRPEQDIPLKAGDTVVIP